MRIAYVSLHWPRPVDSSIGKKINQQTSAWRKAGHTVQVFSHMHSFESPEKLIDGERFEYQTEERLSGLITEINRAQAAAALTRSVNVFQPDIIYLRWAMYVNPIQRLFHTAPVVVEINTRDISEHRLLGTAHSLYNRLTRGIILGSAAGHVFSSRELMALPDFTRFHTTGAVVANGINLQATPLYSAPKSTPLHLIFIGTPGMPWHGVEKLVHFAKVFPDILIDIVGMDMLEGFPNPPENLILHGFLRGAAYEKVLSRADAAIGTLALHLKDMSEAAPLKIRDCAARGIPCILPYVDTDLAGLDSHLFLEIPNTPDNILSHGQKIHDFVLQAHGQRVPRELIFSRIDSHVKESRRLDFFSEILRGG